MFPNVLFYLINSLKLKDIQFTVMYKREKLQILTFSAIKLVFLLKNTLLQLFDNQNNCKNHVNEYVQIDKQSERSSTAAEVTEAHVFIQINMTECRYKSFPQMVNIY